MLSGIDVLVSSQNTSHPGTGRVCFQQEGRKQVEGKQVVKGSGPQTYILRLPPELSVPIIPRRKWRQDMGVGPVLGNSPLKGVLGTSSFATGGPRILPLQHCLLFAWSCRSVRGWAVVRFCEALASRSLTFCLRL